MAIVNGVLDSSCLYRRHVRQINASPWFNLGIAICSSSSAWRCSMCCHRFHEVSCGLDSYRQPRHLRARVQHGRGRRAARRRVRRAGGDSVVLSRADLYATGTRIALALPFFLGVGMAIPWPIAGAGLSALPKPGMWMVRVKQAFGVFILATAAYYGYESYSISPTAGSIRRRSRRACRNS